MRSFKIPANTRQPGKKYPDFLSGDVAISLKKVERQLDAWSASRNPLISEVLGYTLANRGKRIRPALVLLTENLLGAKAKEDVYLAALVEVIHTASLIHDDIVDNSQLRRGRKTVHSRWGPNVTVLIGDYLYIKSIELALKSRYKKIIKILSEVSQQMILGEIDEYVLARNVKTSEKDYLGIIAKKTASLFGASCRIGAILAGASDRTENDMHNFGLTLGMAFQIKDDLLDLVEEERNLGKNVMSDLREGRLTLPIIQALKKAENSPRKFLLSLIGKKSISRNDKQRFFQILSETGALDYARKKAEQYLAQAIRLLEQFPSSPARQMMADLAYFILDRNY